VVEEVHLWLLAAGVAAGLVGSVSGLASLISYPALLAAGLSPVSANVTNTVAVLGVTTGAVAGSRRELADQWPRALRLAAVMVAGGALGAALLLLTPSEVFEVIVPWLIGVGALLLLFRDQVRRWATSRRPTSSATNSPTSTHRHSPAIGRAGLHRIASTAVMLLLGVYGGYFGAGVGIIALAVMALQRTEPLAVTNAVKNVGTGSANAVASLVYVFFGPVDWGAALAMGVGGVLGGLIGPGVVRIAPERPLRYFVGFAGLGLALHLARG
jgi:uncharacterized membrane protein YfcA